MTRPGSLYQRNRAVRNLRAAPSWLSPQRVGRILAVLDRAPAETSAPSPIAIDEAVLAQVVEAAVAAVLPRVAETTATSVAAPAPKPRRSPRRAPEREAVPASIDVDPAAAPPLQTPVDVEAAAPVDTSPSSPPDARPIDAAPPAPVPALAIAHRERIAEVTEAIRAAARAPSTSALQPAARPVTLPPAKPAHLTPGPVASRDIEKLSMAVAYLRNRSISIRAASASPLNSTWAVSGYIDPISVDQVIAMARKEGFEG